MQILFLIPNSINNFKVQKIRIAVERMQSAPQLDLDFLHFDNRFARHNIYTSKNSNLVIHFLTELLKEFPIIKNYYQLLL